MPVNNPIIELIKKFTPDMLVDFFTKWHERSINVKKKIIATFLLKGLSMIISFLFVPLTINYVNPTNYGIWITLSSLIVWFNFFDIGLGNGLRNKLTEAFANKDLNLARIYVSTTYAILSLIIFPVMIIFIIANPFINWTSVFNAPASMGEELSALMLVVFVFFCLKFVLQIFITILYADQKPSLNNALNLIWNLITLITIFILTKTTSGSLFWLGTVISVVPVVVLIITSVYFFRHLYKDFAPSLKFVNFSYAKDLLSLGIQFFIISLAGVVIFSSTNLIISQLYGPAEVTPYNIAYKYFSITTMVFSMAMVPFWSAFTDAFVRKEFDWIKSSVKKLFITWVLLLAFSIFMLIFSGFFYRIWLGKVIEIPFQLSLIVFVYFIFHSLSLIFTSFLNGVGKIRLSLISAVIEAIIYIPAALLFSKYMGLGVGGVVLASALSPLIGCIWMPVQYFKLINQKATGIWNK